MKIICLWIEKHNFLWFKVCTDTYYIIIAK
jgi:hypothetical protein